MFIQILSIVIAALTILSHSCMSLPMGFFFACTSKHITKEKSEYESAANGQTIYRRNTYLWKHDEKRRALGYRRYDDDDVDDAINIDTAMKAIAVDLVW